MKKLLLLCLIPGLAACGVTGPIDVNGLADAATDRIGAEVQIRKEDAKTKQEIAKLLQEKEKTEQEKWKQKASVQIAVDDPTSLAILKLSEANDKLYESNVFLNQTLRIVATGKGEFSDLLSVPAYRKGVIAETLDSLFGGFADVGNSVGGEVLSGGFSVKMISSEVRKASSGGAVYNGDTSFTESHITGSSQATSTIQPYEVTQPAPIVVEPFLAEGD